MTYSATFLEEAGDISRYRIEESKEGNLVRTFIGRVPSTQRATAKGQGEHPDERKVERWCELFPKKLPPDGGTIEMDLDYVARD